MLCLVLRGSTHVFELMLSAFILGLALGGYWIKKSIDDLVNPLKTLGIIQLLMGGFALSTLLFYGQTFNFMSHILTALARSSEGYFLFNIFSQGISMLIMLPAAICAGMTLPIITYYLISGGYGEGVIGKTYAVNTVGAIIGVILAVQVIMPLLGVKNVIITGAAIDVLLGLFLLWYAGAVAWAGENKNFFRQSLSAEVAMMSNIALNKNDEARELLDRYENKIVLPIEIRLLYALAGNEDH
jgi:hypothetical protein